MRRPIVVGNWKMHGDFGSNERLISEFATEVDRESNVGCVVCVPFPYLEQVNVLLDGSNVLLGAQNVNHNLNGAHTGEVSAEMLREVGCSFVIVGHSERRRDNFEDDQTIGKKAKIAMEVGLTPIICVGESLTEREEGRTEDVIAMQIHGLASGIETGTIDKCIIAYEPIWAIGTGQTAKPDLAQGVHGFIRSEIKQLSKEATEIVPIIYGGSIKPDNANELFAMEDIDGGLVGGASLDGKDFIKIFNAAKQQS